MADFSIKAHDLLPVVQATLTHADGSPLDLTLSTNVRFIMRSQTGTVKVAADAEVVIPGSSGVVRYDWEVGDTDTPGAYQAEWEITWQSGKKQTVPTLSYHSIDVLADLDNA
jgi:acyl-coenzyme A thioesterase PaaI-like protein